MKYLCKVRSTTQHMQPKCMATGHEPCSNHKASGSLLFYTSTTHNSEVWTTLRLQTLLTCDFFLLISAIVEVWTCLGNHWGLSMVTFHECALLHTTQSIIHGPFKSDNRTGGCSAERKENSWQIAKLMTPRQCEQKSKLVWSLYYTFAKLLSFLCQSNLASLIKMSSSNT